MFIAGVHSYTQNKFNYICSFKHCIAPLSTRKIVGVLEMPETKD
jgi:hypothetical protein